MTNFKKIITIIFSLLLIVFTFACSFNKESSTPSSSGNGSSGNSTSKDSSSISSSSSQSSEESSSSSSNNGENPSSPSVDSTYKLIKPLNDENSPKALVKTKYPTDFAVVVDAVATDFGADPTGVKDSTSAIQSAINSVNNLGGGSVFLPVGKYLVSSTIIVPSYVSIVGDWNAPKIDNTDENFDYGTVILAKPKVVGATNPRANPLFYVGNCSGVVGITFYYVEQDVENVKDYGYTIYADRPASATFRNLTFINSANGIGVSINEGQNELVNIENVYGTFLFNAIRHNATTDVGFYNNINVSPKYWQNASSDYKCSNPTLLKSFISNNLYAIVLGDLDDQLISNVMIDGGKIGFTFTTGIRPDAGFWGLVYKAKVNCQKGVYADYLNAVCGVVFTDSNVGVVENNSPVGCIKMSNSIYQSVGSGRVVQEGGDIPKNIAISLLTIDFASSERLFIANKMIPGGNVDNTQRLQETLDLVGEDGGIVVIPNGVYRFNSSVVVPKNVEIRSTQAVFSRSSHQQSSKNGVVFISYVSGNTVVLQENAGVVGIRIWHAKNDFITAHNSLSAGTYSNDTSIKANGSGAYAYMNESVGAYVGYDFSSCDNHVLKSNYGISYSNFIKAGGKNGVIVQCLANPNFMTRSNLFNYFDNSKCNVDSWESITNSGENNEDFALLRDGIGRTFTKMVRLENAENQVALNVFCYGHAGLFDMVNSSATLINTSLDYIPGSKFVYELSGGTCDIVGSLRVYGTSIKVNSGRLTAYGRIAFGQVKEKVYDSAVSLDDEIEYVSKNAKRKTLFDCNFSNSSFNVTLNTNPLYLKEGYGSWKWATTTLEGRFNCIDLSEFERGYLHFWIYCTDISEIGSVGQIEITSSGTCDINEYNWNVMSYVTKTGWNEVWLDLSGAGTTGGSADLTNINFMRIYFLDATASFYIDNIEVVTD